MKRALEGHQNAQLILGFNQVLQNPASSSLKISAPRLNPRFGVVSRFAAFCNLLSKSQEKSEQAEQTNRFFRNGVIHILRKQRIGRKGFPKCLHK